MNEFVSFAIDHWILSGLFVATFVVFIAYESFAAHSASLELSPQEAVEQVNHFQGVLVDVRSQEQFSTGHIVGALSVPFDSLESKINTLKKRKNLIIVCANGQQSRKTCERLAKHDIPAKRIRGGMQGWLEAQLPVSRG